MIKTSAVNSINLPMEQVFSISHRKAFQRDAPNQGWPRRRIGHAGRAGWGECPSTMSHLRFRVELRPGVPPTVRMLSGPQPGCVRRRIRRCGGREDRGRPCAASWRKNVRESWLESPCRSSGPPTRAIRILPNLRSSACMPTGQGLRQGMERWNSRHSTTLQDGIFLAPERPQPGPLLGCGPRREGLFGAELP